MPYNINQNLGAARNLSVGGNLTVGSGLIATNTYSNTISIGDATTEISIALNGVAKDLEETDILTMTIFEFSRWNISDVDFLEYIENPNKIVIMSSSSNGSYKNVTFKSAAKKYHPELYEKYRLLIEG